MRAQVQQAMARCDLIIFLTEATTGLHPVDGEIAQILRRLAKPVVLAVNKSEGKDPEGRASEFYRLGLGEPLPISALHNQGIGELMERVLPLLPSALSESPRQERVLRLAIVGRPNVGKSSLLNTILGEERAIVLPEPGTTRDALDTPLVYKGREAVLIDTAGLRRRGRIEPGLDRFSALRAVEAINRCNVAVLVLDGGEGIAAQDTHIAGYVVQAYRGLVLAVNKWDLGRAVGMKEADILQEIRRRFRWAPYAPVCFTVAVTGEGVAALMGESLEVFEERWKRLDPQELSRTLAAAAVDHPLPSRGGRSLRIYGARQSGVDPPTITFEVNYPTLVSFAFRRYLENRLRAAFGFKGNHIHLIFTQKERVKA
jgi:GTP-binding protein